MPTTRLPASHSSWTSRAASIRCASVPQSRATSTRRTELEELREPITSIRSQLASHLLDGRLAVGGRVADVVGAGTDDAREALAQAREDRARFVDRERRLGDVGDALGVGDLELLDVVLALDEHDLVGGLAHRAFDLLVPVVADEHDRVALLGEAHGLAMDLGHERAGGVDRLQAALGRRPRARSGRRRARRTRRPRPRAPRSARRRRSRRARASCSTTCLLCTISLRTYTGAPWIASARWTVCTARSTPAQ